MEDKTNQSHQILSEPSKSPSLSQINHAMEEGFVGMNARIGAAESRLAEKIGEVENKLDAKIDGVENRLDAKIGEVENKLDAKIDGVENRLDAKIDKLDAKIDNMTGIMNENFTKLFSMINVSNRK